MENAAKYGVANNFAKVVQLKTLKAIEKIKSLDEETFFGLTSFSGEPFTLKLGKNCVERIIGIICENRFLCGCR